MKRAVILLLLALCFLTGCAAGESQPQEPYSQFVRNTQYIVDPSARTITVNSHVITYAYIDNGVEITYPNGAVFRRVYVYERAFTESWENADADFISNDGREYADTDVLMMLVPEQPVEKKTEVDSNTVMSVLGGICMIGIGAWMCANPEGHFYWTKGWWFENAEPSEWALGVTTVSGAIMIIGGVIMVIAGVMMCFS